MAQLRAGVRFSLRYDPLRSCQLGWQATERPIKAKSKLSALPCQCLGLQSFDRKSGDHSVRKLARDRIAPS
jgi:hypothetical protein